MILDLPDDIQYEIFYKMYNYDIFTLNITCKKINSLMRTEIFKDYILNRYHPLVFNSDDLYCHKCNLHIYRINAINKMDNIWCRH